MSASSLVGALSCHRALVGLVVSLCLLSSGPGVSAQVTDAAGSKDHPMIKRFEGSAIIGYESPRFSDFVLLLGPVNGKYETFLRGEYEHGRDKLPLTATRTQKIEGEMTRLLYIAPRERSTLEIARNYGRELQGNGFRTLFRCSRQECSTQDGALGWLYLYPPECRLKTTADLSIRALTFGSDQHFVAAKRTSPQGDAYASLYVAKGGWTDHKQTFEHPIILLEVVETAPMENRMVNVDAAAMAKEVAATGHVALYGIYFDTNKADIKAESGPGIDEIAKFLKTDPKMMVYVVGHTDNVGGFEQNMALSQRRAEAVGRELTTKHGIAPARLRPIGSGPASPVAPNETEEGRAKNRRVELVRQ